ncbi:PH domain-containing protein [Flavobacterium granuli]|uniref:YdbS-like PH domain-containing protein n=1 Tax=Flavobacterium granuli TaxID=280093 RepID=A0A1M5T1D2_9FLAO|nr:PH domain-containing protein [Flavobacterium granuli]PRZ20660.1 hypothetical protein BC624_11135 [Flavobacterium granuli]SHH44525.1 hypothetical protein SAMN05443373_11335 [Flavobacterium granuli]
MENFSNETIDTTELPKFEAVQFSVLSASYWKVIVINILMLFLVLGTGFSLLLFYNEEVKFFSVEISLLFVVLLLLTFIFSRISFKKKGFAFREHDVLFRSGMMATNTIIIPYNRIQHVALHEGFVSRYFGLAKIEIFTAGGSSSDLEVPGIAIEQAEKIKQLLMGKIQKQL